MAKKQYESLKAQIKRFSDEDVITGSGVGETAEGFTVRYGSFDSSWISSAEE